MVEYTLMSGHIGNTNRRTHNMSGTPIYSVWATMKARCDNPSNHKYTDYGGRGIRVCDRWQQFTNFFLDMGNVPNGMTLDRRDNNGNYTPENCRWATATEQARNRRSNHIVSYKGEDKSMIEWAEEYSIPYQTLLARVNKLGWLLEKALSTTVGKMTGRKKKEIH